MATVYTPDNCTEFQSNPTKLSVFLAGTIDNGASIDWQQELIKLLADNDNIVLYNPRKASWDKNAGPEAVEKQVLWELEMQDKVDLVIMNILPGSQSPICLLELGLHLGHEKPLILACSEGYGRHPNVRVTAKQYDVDIMDNGQPDYLSALAQELLDIHDCMADMALGYVDSMGRATLMGRAAALIASSGDTRITKPNYLKASKYQQSTDKENIAQ